MLYSTSFFTRRGVLLLTVLCAFTSVRACGPDFPNAYLTLPAGDLARLPTLDFSVELSRIQIAIQPFSVVDDKTAAIRGQAELREALLAAGVPPARIEGQLAGSIAEDPPSELSREFHLYAEGAREWRDRNYGRALACWREVLALPAAERHYRSVWAAYMIGRAQWDGDGAAACRAFSQVRELAGQGFADSQGLAAASLGWQARVYLRHEQFPEAVQFYLRQYASGDQRAAVSLQLAIRAAFMADEARAGGEAGENEDLAASPLVALAREQDAREAVTAWFVARGGPYIPWSTEAVQRFRRWIKALAATAPLAPAEADRWAWAAYQNGLWEEASKFAGQAPANAAASEWVRAMLLLREGKVPAAIEHLAAAAKSFQQDTALASPAFDDDGNRFESMHEDSPASQLGGVRGVLALRRSQYIEALRLFREAGHWADTAYVAEKVLTLEELTAFVRSETQPAPPASPATGGETSRSLGKSADPDLRHLLARRLVRAGKFDEAREYFPAETVAGYDHYIAAVRKGYDHTAPKAERADALWTAAQLVEQHGMAWQGTELAPDYAITDGDFSWPEITRVLSSKDDFSTTYLSAAEREKLKLESATLVPLEEAERVWASGEPSRKFHYRHRATELAFLAATLLPDDDEHTATILNTAGWWIAHRYPQDAQIFYKTLVFRCPNTALGKAAAAHHWLVLMKDQAESQ